MDVGRARDFFGATVGDPVESGDAGGEDAVVMPEVEREFIDGLGARDEERVSGALGGRLEHEWAARAGGEDAALDALQALGAVAAESYGFVEAGEWRGKIDAHDAAIGADPKSAEAIFGAADRGHGREPGNLIEPDLRGKIARDDQRAALERSDEEAAVGEHLHEVGFFRLQPLVDRRGVGRVRSAVEALEARRAGKQEDGAVGLGDEAARKNLAGFGVADGLPFPAGSGE